MSMHKIPLSELERKGLTKHGLNIGTPSQLSDCFRSGMKWALDNAVPEGWKLAPVEPTAEQYGGLARDIIQWMRFTPSSDQHSQSLIEWLKNMGNEIPSWLMGENEINHLSKHVLSKGTIAAIIYKAMLEAAPDGNK